MYYIQAAIAFPTCSDLASASKLLASSLNIRNFMARCDKRYDGDDYLFATVWGIDFFLSSDSENEQRSIMEAELHDLDALDGSETDIDLTHFWTRLIVDHHGPSSAEPYHADDPLPANFALESVRDGTALVIDTAASSLVPDALAGRLHLPLFKNTADGLITETLGITFSLTQEKNRSILAHKASGTLAQVLDCAHHSEFLLSLQRSG